MTTPGRDELSHALQQLAAASGLAAAELARRAGISEATMSRYLSGKIAPGPEQVRNVIAAMGHVAEGDVENVIQLAEDLRDGTASRVVVIRPGTISMRRMQQRIGRLEDGASHIGSFGLGIVPGLLQTADYARAVFTSGGRSATDAQDAVQARMSRQRLLDDPSRRFTQVMTESALRWRVRGPDLMCRQIDFIADLTRTHDPRRVRIGVIPWTQAVDVFPMTGFDFYDESMAIVGAGFGTSFLTRPLDVGAYVEQLEHLVELAVFGDDARAVLDSIAQDYRRPSE